MSFPSNNGWFSSSLCKRPEGNPMISFHSITIKHPGWWFQPIWKILVKWDEYPNIWRNKKGSKPPTSTIFLWFSYGFPLLVQLPDAQFSGPRSPTTAVAIAGGSVVAFLSGTTDPGRTTWKVGKFTRENLGKNHRKTIGKWWCHGIFMGFTPLVMTKIAMENGWKWLT